MPRFRVRFSVGPIFLAAIAALCWLSDVRGAEEAVWQPAKTRVFIVSLARFQNDRLHSFTPAERIDNQFAELFQQRGVPANHIAFLKDEQATTENIKSEFTRFLRKSGPGEMLFF